MTIKTFIVTHPKARAPITVHGATLAAALKIEGLNPNIWKEAAADHKVAEPENGDNQGDAGQETD